ncbi:cytochrome c3 family protein [Roseimaritima ulvae]|uniref:Doubled CXXCH motif (Paired_CXXCH_1) n=1 Tax=Roseimaritima ulvae TaxID=980254 RepID=A0A5B9QQV3_9BACT|nr:cytochrome c3 family protein [Roseimaritima ulvae]QEG40289.1 Doubled CXXCH motif (Paired_CXXCH_1) [Roseimaritima ulvae]
MRRKEIKPLQPPWFDRPSDRWVCGHADEGHACAHGPDPAGGCPGLGPCRPVQTNSGWKCSRPTCLGGGCEPGPSADGTCGQQPTPCNPRVSWHYRRRQLILGGTAAALAVLCLLIGVRWRGEPLRPGPLHRSHAQILGGQLASDRCAACHPAAKGSLLNWFVSAEFEHAGVSQSQLCIECHHVKIDPQRATMAHNLTVEELRLISRSGDPSKATRGASSWHDRLPGPEFGNTTAECSACHREHRGPDHSLTALTNHQCQTCHQDRFASFASDHPDWTDWPYGRGGAIAFNHATHANKHFATAAAGGKAEPFDCRRCHTVTSGGEIARSGNFEATCASCHDASLKLEAAEGLELFALPALPQPPREWPDWPVDAQGFYDGRVEPLTEWLIAADPQVRAALAELPSGRDFAKINPNDAAQVAAAQTVASAIANLTDELAANSQQAIRRRLTASGVSSATASRVAAYLSPQLIYDARLRWFGSPPRGTQPVQPGIDPQAARRVPSVLRWVVHFENPLRELGDADAAAPSRLDTPPPRMAQLTVPEDDPLLLPLGEDDPLLEDVLSASSTDAAEDALQRGDFDAAVALPDGGWYQDDLRLAIRYRGGGHADPILQALVDAAAELPADSPLAARVLQNRAIAGCVQCHPPSGGNGALRWTSGTREPGRKEFTRFRHQPHFNLPNLADCRYCHKVAGDAAGVRLASTQERLQQEFEPLRKAACAVCHTSQAAGDNCTQCHNYHVTK